SQTVSATGNLAPANTVAVSFGTSGTIAEIDINEGDHVDAGQVLGKLDTADAQSALTVAQLNYQSALEKYNSAQSAGTSTTTTRTASTSGSAAQTQSPSGQTDSSSIYSAQASLLQAQSSMESAQKALDATTLKAPSAGTISVISNVVGDKVSGSTSSAT